MLDILAVVKDSEKDNITELALNAWNPYSLYPSVLRGPLSLDGNGVEDLPFASGLS